MACGLCRDVPARRLFKEARAVRAQVRRFAPEAWLVYGATKKNPDLFGWWLHPKRYVSIQTGVEVSQDLPMLWRWLFAFAHRRALSRADVVAAWRPITARALRSDGFKHTCVLPQAIRLWDDVPSQEDARRDLRLPQQAVIILCVSRLTAPRADGRPWKTEYVLEVLNALALAHLPPDAIFILVGDGPGRDRVEQHIAKLHLHSLVRLAGAVTHDAMKRYYAACDFCVYPDFKDQTFLTLLEAQGCGRPVVTTETESTQLIVDKDRTGLLAKDLDEFREHVATLAADRTRCELMGHAAREYIAEHHSIEQRVCQIEEKLLGSRIN